jgi:hypothetical protein
LFPQASAALRSLVGVLQDGITGEPVATAPTQEWVVLLPDARCR